MYLCVFQWRELGNRGMAALRPTSEFAWQPQHYNIRECFQFGLTSCRVYEARLAIAIYLCEHREDVHVGRVRYCMGVCVRCHFWMSMCMCLSCV